MTKDTRIDLLKQIEKDIYVNSLESTFKQDSKSCAIHEAIEILQKEPCEDAISRSEAMNVLDALYLDGESAQGFTADANGDCLIGKYKAIQILDELPSVNPQIQISDEDYGKIYESFKQALHNNQQNVGKWITLKDEYGDVVEAVCSNCGKNGSHKWKYCPDCGSMMMEEGE